MKDLDVHFRREQRALETEANAIQELECIEGDVVQEWQEATEAVIQALVRWRIALDQWQRERLNAPKFELALGRLCKAVLERWGPIEWPLL